MQHSEGVTAAVCVVGFPTSEATIHDNWQVGGLRGTGSNDFSVRALTNVRAHGVSEPVFWPTFHCRASGLTLP
jgi:hypothetical protein